MNAIEQIDRDICEKLKGVKTILVAPLVSSGPWFLDIFCESTFVVVEWRPNLGFGVSLVDESTVFGDCTDEIFTTTDETVNRVIQLLTNINPTKVIDKQS